MPYISRVNRPAFEALQQLERIEGPGELNYALTLLAKRYVELHGLSYKTVNDVLGALDGAKAEFYRRVAVPYEDKKIAENGDVY